MLINRVGGGGNPPLFPLLKLFARLKRQTPEMQVRLPYICLKFSGFSNVYHSACVWPAALKLECITNFDMLFLVMGFSSLVDEIQFILIRL